MHEDPIMKIMKNKVKIKWFSEKQRLLQGVKKGLQFAFVSQKNEQCMPLAYCKDYLQDAIQAHLLNKKKKKYGFVYDPEVHPKICIEKCKLLVAHAQMLDVLESNRRPTRDKKDSRSMRIKSRKEVSK